MSTSNDATDYVMIRPSDASKGYFEWQQFVRENERRFSPDDIKWLAAWESYDLACSPMDDAKRSVLRQGHYLGWKACILELRRMLDDTKAR